ncbi:hypothetical protein [Paraburkholderia sp. J41]|uniref:hypothetical protein n=1 Tax=Paraburkholderia sp. J41 TaxID=2805433 RepID=UPI002AC34E57|nr:hypothetical protein [Paraburkholderia sp. J41]
MKKQKRIWATLFAAVFCVVSTSFAGHAYAEGQQAQGEYIPVAKDFFGKWKLVGAGIMQPQDFHGKPSQKQEKAADLYQQGKLAFYQSFDYLEITADGHYNFHQPGDPAGMCVWCGTWSFKGGSLWLSTSTNHWESRDTAPRLDEYAKGGDIQMTFTKESNKTSLDRWQAFGWKKLN